MSSASPSVKEPPVSISKDEWFQAMSSVDIDHHQIDNLIMNYLVIEGYQEAAQLFETESGVSAGIDLSTIQERMQIRSAVERGDIHAAIDKVNDLNPEILDTNQTLCFHLQQQKFIELIRLNKIEEALDFAQDEMAPRAAADPSLVEDLERTMTLLALGGLPNVPGVSELLDVSQRYKTASELNAAILASLSQEKDPKLPTLLRMVAWVQEELSQRMSFPKIKDFETGEWTVVDK
eukprot:ANDGO_08084.mRNA.1 Glucose-induced degradation protein 8 homolog